MDNADPALETGVKPICDFTGRRQSAFSCLNASYYSLVDTLRSTSGLPAVLMKVYGTAVMQRNSMISADVNSDSWEELLVWPGQLGTENIAGMPFFQCLWSLNYSSGRFAYVL